MSTTPLCTSSTVRFSPDGRYCGAIGYHGRVFDIANGGCLSTDFAPLAVAFSLDGRFVAFADCAEAWLHALPNLEVVRPLNEVRCPGPELEFSPCGQYLVIGFEEDVEVRHIATGELAFRYQQRNSRVMHLLCSAKRDIWVTAHLLWRTWHGRVYFVRHAWPFTPGSATVLPFRVLSLNCAALSSDGDLLAAITDDLTPRPRLEVFSISGRMIVHRADVARPERLRAGIGWSHCGRFLAYVNGASMTVLDFPRRTVVAEYPMTEPADVAFSPDGTHIALGDWEEGRIERFAPAGSVR